MKLDAKKDKLWLSADPTKWELPTIPKLSNTQLLSNKILSFKYMCFKENTIEKELKELFAYYNELCLKEVSKGLDLKAYNYKKSLENFAKETQNIYDEMIKEWNSAKEFCLQDMSQKPSLFKGQSVFIEKINRTKKESVEIAEKKGDSNSD